MKTARELMLERAKVHFNEEAELARKGLNPAKILELRTAIANGEVDPGPPVEHEFEAVDNRDKRDPSLLGKEFLARHNGFADLEPRTNIKPKPRIEFDEDMCMCYTIEEGWRPCPANLCELPNHKHVSLTKPSVVLQFNNGICSNCNWYLIETPYVGGDHDPIANCSGCGKHYGCSVCDFGKALDGNNA